MVKTNRGQSILSHFLEEVQEEKIANAKPSNARLLAEACTSKDDLDEQGFGGEDPSKKYLNRGKQKFPEPSGRGGDPASRHGKMIDDEPDDEEGDEEDDRMDESTGKEIWLVRVHDYDDQTVYAVASSEQKGKSMKQELLRIDPDLEGYLIVDGPFILDKVDKKKNYEEEKKRSMSNSKMMDEAAFSRQHYIAIAKILKDAAHGEAGETEVIQEIGEKLANLFRQDNPRFDEPKFLAAAGLEDSSAETHYKTTEEDVVDVMNKKTGIKFKKTPNSQGKM